MKPVDAHWAAGVVMDAAVAFTLAIEGALEDLRGAIEADDHATTFEICATALTHLALIERSLEATPLGTGEPEVQLAVLAHHDDDSLALLAQLPPVHRLDQDTVADVADRVARQADALRAILPFEIPLMRTPEGFFPSVKAARHLDQLRARLGMIEYPWTDMAE